MAGWAVVTFDKSVDRAAHALRLVRALSERGMSVAGFVQRRAPGGELEAGRVTVCRVGRADELPLGRSGANRAEGKEAMSSCSFAFRDDSFEHARRWLAQDAPSAQVLVVGELSKLEAEKKGHYAAARWALLQPAKTVVLYARADQLSYLIERLEPEGEPIADLVLPAGEPETPRFLELLAAAVRPER